MNDNINKLGVLSLAAVRFIMASIILFFTMKIKEKNVVIEKGDHQTRTC